jgi:hypothetical protein
MLAEIDPVPFFNAIDTCSDEALTAGHEITIAASSSCIGFARISFRSVDWGHSWRSTAEIDLERRAHRLSDCVSSRLRSFRETRKPARRGDVHCSIVKTSMFTENRS